MNKRKSINKGYKISSYLFPKIGEFYIHNNPHNFANTVNSLKTKKLDDLADDLEKVAKITAENHAEKLRKKALIFSNLLGTNGLDDLLTKMRGIFTEAMGMDGLYIPYLNSFKEISVKAFDVLIDENREINNKEMQKFYQDFSTRYMGLLNAVSSFVAQEIEKGRGMDLDTIFLKETEERMKEKISLREGQEIDEAMKKLIRNIEKSHKQGNREQLTALYNKLVKDWSIIGWGNSFFEGTFYSAGGHIFEPFIKDATSKILEREFGDKFTVETVGREQFRTSVIDIVIKSKGGVEIGVSLKHLIKEDFYTSKYSFHFVSNDLYEMFKNKEITGDAYEMFNYMMNNIVFLGLNKKGNYFFEKIKSIERRVYKYTMLSRVFDALYQGIEDKDDFRLSYRARKVNNKYEKLASTIFWFTGYELVYTHDVLNYLIKQIYEKGDTGDDLSVKGFKYEFKKRKIKGVAEEDFISLQSKKRSLIKEVKKGSHYAFLSRKLESEMRSQISKLDTKRGFYHNLHRKISYEELFGSLSGGATKIYGGK